MPQRPRGKFSLAAGKIVPIIARDWPNNYVIQDIGRTGLCNGCFEAAAQRFQPRLAHEFAQVCLSRSAANTFTAVEPLAYRTAVALLCRKSKAQDRAPRRHLTAARPGLFGRVSRTLLGVLQTFPG